MGRGIGPDTVAPVEAAASRICCSASLIIGTLNAFSLILSFAVNKESSASVSSAATAAAVATT